MKYNKKTAFIFAAGLGTRLRPLTDTRPKALVEIAGKPLLQIAIEKIKGAGFQRIVVNAHHFAEQIFDFVEKTDFGVEVTISHEKEQLLDTGGGISFAEKLIGNEPFLAYNVDIITFYRQHNNENLATILVSNRPTSRYLLFDSSNRLVGWQNAVTGELKTPFANLDVDKYKKLAFNGIHVISPNIFSLMKDFKSPFSITDFYISVCSTESIIGYEQPDLQVTDVGKIEQLKNISNKFI